MIFCGAMLIYFFAGLMAVPETMLPGSGFARFMALALAIPTVAFWLGAAAGRSGAIPMDTDNCVAAYAKLVWPVIAGLQIVPVVLLFAALVFIVNGRPVAGRPLPLPWMSEALPLLVAIYAAVPWIWALGIRPARLRRLVAVSSVTGIAATAVMVAVYIFGILFPR